MCLAVRIFYRGKKFFTKKFDTLRFMEKCCLKGILIFTELLKENVTDACYGVVAVDTVVYINAFNYYS